MDLLSHDEVVEQVELFLDSPEATSVVVSSVNLDHIHHYRGTGVPHATQEVERWLFVADGWPVAWRAGQVTSTDWPRVAGSDLLPAVLDGLNQRRGRLAVLGGTETTQHQFRAVLADRYGKVAVTGMWAPGREVLTDGSASERLAREIAASAPDVLLVSLPKPLSERWIASYAGTVGARVYLPFGAAADFLAGAIRRAPRSVQRMKLEWLYRLALEPRRLARRYLVQGPQSFRFLLKPVVICPIPRGPDDIRQPKADS